MLISEQFVHYDEIATLIAPPEEVVNGFFAWLENVKQRYQMVEWKLDVDAIHLWTTVEIGNSQQSSLLIDRRRRHLQREHRYKCKVQPQKKIGVQYVGHG